MHLKEPTSSSSIEERSINLFYRTILTAFLFLAMAFALSTIEQTDSKLAIGVLAIILFALVGVVTAERETIGQLRAIACSTTNRTRIIVVVASIAISVAFYLWLSTYYNNPERITFMLISLFMLVLAVITPSCKHLEGENHV